MLPSINFTWIQERFASSMIFHTFNWTTDHCWFADIHYSDQRIGLVINDDGTVDIDGIECLKNHWSEDKYGNETRIDCGNHCEY